MQYVFLASRLIGTTAMLHNFVSVLPISPTHASWVRCNAASLLSLHICILFLGLLILPHGPYISHMCSKLCLLSHLWIILFLLWMAHTCCLIKYLIVKIMEIGMFILPNILFGIYSFFSPPFCHHEGGPAWFVYY
jgi:hypothetical protein